MGAVAARKMQLHSRLPTVLDNSPECKPAAASDDVSSLSEDAVGGGGNDILAAVERPRPSLGAVHQSPITEETPFGVIETTNRSLSMVFFQTQLLSAGAAGSGSSIPLLDEPHSNPMFRGRKDRTDFPVNLAAQLQQVSTRLHDEVVRPTLVRQEDRDAAMHMMMMEDIPATSCAGGNFAALPLGATGARMGGRLGPSVKRRCTSDMKKKNARNRL